MNPSTALATVLVNALLELGVRQVVLCPGSRSAPLAYALAAAASPELPADRRIRLQVRIDERSAGFLALGLAKAEGSPAAVITTSGTAVANLHPAVLEAAEGGVPLLVISADRPHELRGTGASQTTDQVKLFGDAVRWFAEIPAPQRQAGQVVAWRNIVSRAVAVAVGNPGGRPGPVHLNVAFADPLLPGPGVAGQGVARVASGDLAEDRPDWPEPLTGPTGAAGLTVVAAAVPPAGIRLPAGPRTVVLAGDGAGPQAAVLAASTGWPLLAEPSSGARVGTAIGPYRLLLDLPDLGQRIERVVLYGHPTLSRPVTRLLARPDVELIVVSARPDWADAGRHARLVTPGVSGPGSERSALQRRADADWAAAWSTAGSAAALAIDQLLDDEATAGRLTGPLIAREVAAATLAGDVLFAGSSNPIRDLDLAAGPFDPLAVVLANRGLAGIDGTLSSASGVALARAEAAPGVTAAAYTGDPADGGAPAGGGPSAGSGPSAGGQVSVGQVRCLVGDLTFLHDVGALLVGPLEERPNLQIVVLDDDGGGIFGLLEHGELAQAGTAEQQRFERIFGTPQIADLAALCSGYGVRHELIDDVEALRKALAAPPPGTSVLHLRIDRSAQRPLAARLTSAAQAAVAGCADRH